MKNHEGRDIEFKHGLASLDLQYWKQFEDFIVQNENLKGYIFRGVRCSKFELLPSLTRLLREHGKTLGAQDLGQQLLRFRLAIRGRVSLPERELVSSSELWSIGQHHGLATPLLDWTASPLVAGFFAFAESGNDWEKRSVFALYAKRINQLFSRTLRDNLEMEEKGLSDKLAERLSFAEEQPDYGRDSVLIVAERIAERLLPVDFDLYSKVAQAMDATEIDVPRIISPLSGENRRLVSQRGLFTNFTNLEPLEAWVVHNFCKKTGEPYASDQQMLVKVDIPNTHLERTSALSALDRANINYLSLFPDVEGAARFANSKL